MTRKTYRLALSIGLALTGYSFDGHAASYDGSCMDAPVRELPANSTVVRVSSESALQQAMGSLSNNTVVLLAPGQYRLSNTLWVQYDNVTIRGDSDRCDEVVLIGKGMENAAGRDSVPHGVWTNRSNTRVENLTIRDVYYHGVSVSGSSDSPEVYNVRLLDSGQQFIKVNPLGFGDGADGGKVEYSVMKYTAGPPVTDHGGGTGYTNGVDVHAGDGWTISNNRFENFHTADNTQNLWNPAILMWNGASNTLVENNTFIDVDRAIAFGLIDRNNDHRNGIVRNNMITLRPGLFSASRREQSDAMILVWSSPGTKVFHNTILTQGNTNKSIELRFNSNGASIKHNLVSAPISDRSGNSFTKTDNVETATASMFKGPATGDLHLKAPVSGITGAVPVLSDAALDFDGQSRGADRVSDVGADETEASGGGGVGECRAI